MATFEAQVEALTGLSIDGSSAPTQTELTQFLTDGAKEIINYLPKHLLPLCSAEETFTSGTPNTLNTGKILNVFRNDGDIKQPCRQIDSSYKGRVLDSDDMDYASLTDPVYYIENNTIDVIPSNGTVTYSEVQYPAIAYNDSVISSISLSGVTATAADPSIFTKTNHGLSTGDVVKLSGFSEMTELNGMVGTVNNSISANQFLINGISGDPEETTGGNVFKLGGFPDEAEYLIPLYASIKSLQNAIEAIRALANTQFDSAVSSNTAEDIELSTSHLNAGNAYLSEIVSMEKQQNKLQADYDRGLSLLKGGAK
jgi:hypothetical protein